jgi:DNA-binding beta-propeller fold protein YncE
MTPHDDSTAQRVRVGLDHAVARHQLSPDSWPRIERRLRTQPRRRALIAAIAATVAVASIIGGTTIWRDQIRHPSTPNGSSPEHLAVTGRLRLPQGAGGLAAGAGAIWVSGLSVTYRVDSATDKITATIPTAGTDEFSRIAVGFGAVWVTGGNRPGDHLGVYRISQGTDKVTAFIPMPQVGLPGAVAVAAGRLWVGSDEDGGSILRVDPHTNRIVGRRINLGLDVGAIVPGAGLLWVTHNNAGGSVTAISPATGKVADLHGSAWSKVTGVAAVGDGSLWSAAANKILRVDATSGQFIASIVVPGAVQGISWIAFWHGSIWAISTSTTGSGGVVRIDPALNRVVGKPVAVGTTPAALTAGPSGLWVTDFTDQQLVRLALSGASS